MERLTEYAIPAIGRGTPKKFPCFSEKISKNDCPLMFCHKAEFCDSIKNRECPYLQVMDRLAAYEDTMQLERAQELAQAEKNGRLVVLPCKVGDTVYVTYGEGYKVCIVDRIHVIANNQVQVRMRHLLTETLWLSVSKFGKTVFLTREEAEAALKKREEAGNEAD